MTPTEATRRLLNEEIQPGHLNAKAVSGVLGDYSIDSALKFHLNRTISGRALVPSIFGARGPPRARLRSFTVRPLPPPRPSCP